MAPLVHQPSLLNRIARVLLCLVFVHAVIGKLTGFAGVTGAIAAKGLPLAPLLLVAAMTLMVVGSALVISGWRSSAACCWWPIRTATPEGGFPQN